MGKKIKNPISVIVTENDGVHRVRVDYGVVCDDHAIEERRSLEITLNPQTINDIHEETVAQIHAHEGTAEIIN